MSQRRRRRRVVPTRGSASPPTTNARVVVRPASMVVRLTYTRVQAAAALGISRSTFIRRVLPYVETVEVAGGSRLIPVDELERFVQERRKRKNLKAPEQKRLGRPGRLSPELVARIRADRGAGKTFAEIADALTAESVATAHGGKRWWPSTVRAVAARP